MGRQVIDIRKDGEKVYVKNHAKVTFLSDGTNVEQRIIDVSNDLSTKVNKTYIDDILENIIIDSSQIDFNQLQNNPFVDNNSGKLEVMDEYSNIIAKIDAEGIHSVDFIAGEHRLSDKTDKTYVDEAVKNVKVDLTGYATEEWVENKNYLTEHQDISHLATKDEVSNIDFYNIKDNPIVNNGDGKLLFVDENGYIGLQLEEDGLYVKDVIADGHTLSQKADKSELSNYATKDEVSDLVDMSVVTELQGKVNTLVSGDTNMSVRDIAVDVLTETLVSETATEAYDTLAEMSAWIKSHPEDAAAMNEAIQKNASDITNTLTSAKSYTDETIADIDFYSIKNNPIVNSEDGTLTFVDESGYIGLKVTEDGLVVKDVVTPEHTLSNKADKSELPTKVSDLTNDSGFITLADVPEVEIPSLDEYVKSEDLPNFDEFAKTSDIPSLDGYAKTEDIPSLDGYATEQWVNNKNYATEYDLNNIDYSSINNVPVSEDETGELNITDESGNIGMKVASEAVYAKDFVAGEHKLSEKVDKTYVDNSIAELVDGAPETLDTLNELAAALNDNADIVDVLNQSISNKQDAITDLETIRQGAAKGATALQSYTEQYKGTVTGVKINGTTKNPSSGIVDLGTVITAHQTLKTINGESIVGSGDITISGGGDYLPLTGGTITGDLTLTNGTGGPGNLYANTISALEVSGSRFLFSFSKYVLDGSENSLQYCNNNNNPVLTLTWKGDGTKFLSDDGTYKTISGGGGSSDANVQAVDTGDVLDDVTVDYATKTYVDGLIGDINSVLESIING